MRRPKAILALLVVLSCVVSTRPSAVELPVSAHARQIKWPTGTIQVALSTSLMLPAAGIKPESDVTGAVHRALQSWSHVANINFVEVSSKAQSISPVNWGDGINLITIAPTTENLATFGQGNDAARTRVFYDPETGDINEADIVLNPYAFSSEGELRQFSTDGTPGTYDLESTLAHEIGHLLGLNHSHVIAATMRASQGLNGIYGLPALAQRTLSEADQIAVRSIYGPCENLGSVDGRILNNVEGSLLPAIAAHVWIEDLVSGRVMAGSLTTPGGTFSIDCVPTGNYRAMVEYVTGSDDGPIARAATLDHKPAARSRTFRSVEVSNRLRIVADKTVRLNYVLVPPQNFAPAVNPRLIGINGELSTVALPVAAGTKLTVYVGGDGIDQIPGTGLSVSSPFITIDPASLTLQPFYNSTPVISFEVRVAANVLAGDYSIRFQSNSGEIAYLVGGITIDPKS